MKTVTANENYLNTRSWLFILVLAISGVEALKNVSVVIPQAVKAYDTVTLLCTYDLEFDDIYSVKWYKEFRKFFSYVPREQPNIKVFPIPGINVDVNRSGQYGVVLQNVQPEVTGEYVCEVTTTRFQTGIASNYMNVVDMPNSDPTLEISKEDLKSGYILIASCSSPPSFPAMNVTWYINDIEVKESASKKINVGPVNESSSNNRTMIISYLEKEIDESIYQGEVVTIQCVTSLFNLYRSEKVEYLENYEPDNFSSSEFEVSESCAVKVPAWEHILVLFIVCVLR